MLGEARALRFRHCFSSRAGRPRSKLCGAAVRSRPLCSSSRRTCDGGAVSQHACSSQAPELRTSSLSPPVVLRAAFAVLQVTRLAAALQAAFQAMHEAGSAAGVGVEADEVAGVIEQLAASLQRLQEVNGSFASQRLPAAAGEQEKLEAAAAVLRAKRTELWRLQAHLQAACCGSARAPSQGPREELVAELRRACTEALALQAVAEYIADTCASCHNGILEAPAGAQEGTRTVGSLSA